MVYSPNSGCAEMNMIDYIEPGGMLVQNHANLSATCGPTQWAGMARAVEGDHSSKGAADIQDLLTKANVAGSVLAEFCFQAFAGQTFYDASRVNLPCVPSNIGVKWIYPLGSTQPEHQSGCGDTQWCWNMYTWDHNDKMQLAHSSTEYVVVLGDTGDTSCNDGEFECCSSLGGCVPGYTNSPSVIGSCPATPPAGFSTQPSGYPGTTPSPSSSSSSTGVPLPTDTTPTSPVVVPTSPSIPSVSTPSYPSVPSASSPSIPSVSTPCMACTESPITTPYIPTPVQNIVTLTETDWITITTWETVCVGPYGCYGSFGNYEPTSPAVRKRATSHQHKHIRGLNNEHAKWHWTTHMGEVDNVLKTASERLERKRCICI